MPTRRTRMQRMNDGIRDAEAEAYRNSPECAEMRARNEARPEYQRELRIDARLRELLDAGVPYIQAQRQAREEIDAELAAAVVP